MVKQWIKKYTPKHHEVKEHPHLRHFGELLHDPNLWHLNRRSVSKGLALGVFLAFMPVPIQMILAAMGAIWLRVNLPIAVAAVWITNPVTLTPIYYFCYYIGTLFMGIEPHHAQFEFSFEWLTTEFLEIWRPLIIGCLVVASISSLVSFLSVRAIWRWQIWQRIKQRREARKRRKKD